MQANQQNKYPTIDPREVKFYDLWEDFFDKMSDEDLEIAIYMIKRYNALNQVAKDEYAYRTHAPE